MADIGCVLHALIAVPTNRLRVAQLTPEAITAVASSALEVPERAGAVIALLTLEPRDSFFDPPKPYNPRDVMPWRFNRALSYLRRPLVLVRDAEAGDQYLFGPGMCFGAAEFLDELTRTARLGQEGSALRRATIELQRALSREFENTVAEAFDAAPTWAAGRRVKKLGSRRIQRPNGQDLGDVDVLAACSAVKLIVCVEAKSLAGALAPHQLKHELDANFSASAKKPSAATRLMERANFVAAHIDEVLRMFGIDDDPAGWRVASCMVTDYENLSALIETTRVPVLTLRELRVQLADGSLLAGFDG